MNNNLTITVERYRPRKRDSKIPKKLAKALVFVQNNRHRMILSFSKRLGTICCFLFFQEISEPSRDKVTNDRMTSKRETSPIRVTISYKTEWRISTK